MGRCHQILGVVGACFDKRRMNGGGGLRRGVFGGYNGGGILLCF